ncbi:DUF6221 family protein [Streptomyces sp. NPDC058108]|uniref:DUF6221 family protein n=1 Tax=Streptomyces sp. NPDC058108 TaxID=3346344 RepID=UPI0036E3F55C
MSEIADFLRARIAERRAVAEAASPGPWHPNAEHDEVVAVDGITVADGFALSGRQLRATVEHIAAHDPAAVIADLDAKLALIDEIDPPLEDAEPATDAELHEIESHPAYEYRTTSGPRKQWDDADVPPRDDNGNPEPGWERNIDAGRDGWERWGYIEESYWRRPRPGGPRKPHIPRTLKILAQPFAGHPDHRGEGWAP